MEKVIIHEVGLRDGLQMESEPVPTITKEEWVKLLIQSNIDIIQLGSFVNPQKVPQMADTDDLFELFSRTKAEPQKPIFSALVLNEKGLERALAVNTDMICMGVSASDTHSSKNTGMTSLQALDRILEMAKVVKKEGKKLQVSVQSAFGCGFEGEIPEKRVFQIVEEYFKNGIQNISLADTAGMAYPTKVERMYAKLMEMDPNAQFACHFHNTYGMGLLNVYTALKLGVRYVETAFGGLGGCPFTKQPAGNVCTEDFVFMLQRMGFRQDIDISKIIAVSKYASGFFIKDLPGYIYKIKRENENTRRNKGS